MKQLGEDKVGVEPLKSVWLLRLPESTQAILAHAEFKSLAVLANTVAVKLLSTRGQALRRVSFQS